MLRYMARVRWQDRISCEEVAKKKVTMVWSCEKGNGGRSVEISVRNGSIRKKKSRKTKENLERYSEEGFGTNTSG